MLNLTARKPKIVQTVTAKQQQNKQRMQTKKDQNKELQKLREKEWTRRTKGENRQGNGSTIHIYTGFNLYMYIPLHKYRHLNAYTYVCT